MRIFAPALLLLFAVVCPVCADCVQIPTPEFGRVEIVAMDFSGRELPNPDFEIMEAKTRKSFKASIDGMAAARVPYGNYVVRIWSQGFAAVERAVRVYQPETRVRVELPVAIECSGYVSLRARVNHTPANRLLWAKLVSLRGTAIAESPVTSAGAFLISGLDAGHYLLIILDGDSVLHTETVSLGTDRTLRVNLASR